ncbi:MAG: hypothetical protein MRJ68_14605, partial [Nitrospira sp.]|nr:hypothetical protein [Nitrospira sp.]
MGLVQKVCFWIKNGLLTLSLGVVLSSFAVGVYAAEVDHSGEPGRELHQPSESGHLIPGLSFRVFVDRGAEGAASGALGEAEANEVLQTVLHTFSYLNQRRQHYPRFDEAVSKGMLERVIVQPVVRNHEGKTFPFLVVRTVDPGRVRLLISASSMKERGYLGQAERFAPVLVREFQ